MVIINRGHMGFLYDIHEMFVVTQNLKLVEIIRLIFLFDNGLIPVYRIGNEALE
jgi:hypothetical protein